MSFAFLCDAMSSTLTDKNDLRRALFQTVKHLPTLAKLPHLIWLGKETPQLTQHRSCLYHLMSEACDVSSSPRLLLNAVVLWKLGSSSNYEANEDLA